MCWCQLKCMVAWKCTSGPAFCAEGASYRAQGAECSSSCISGPFVDISLSPWFISVTVSHSVHVPNTNCLYGTTGLADIRGNGNSKIWMPVPCAGNLSVSINETCPECQLGSQQPLARKGEYCLAAGILRGGVVLLAWKSSLRTNFFWSLYWKKKNKLKKRWHLFLGKWEAEVEVAELPGALKFCTAVFSPDHPLAVCIDSPEMSYLLIGSVFPAFSNEVRNPIPVFNYISCTFWK